MSVLRSFDFAAAAANFTRDLSQINVGSTNRNSLHAGGLLTVDDPRELRKLAEWYRTFAEVGRSEHRDARLNWAAYLERRADALERPVADDPGSRRG
jgi:hypothetical protein